MAWETRPKDPDLLRSAEFWAFRAFLWFRNNGHRRQDAIANGAATFGVTARRFRSLIENEAIAIDREEYERLCEGQRRHLEEKAKVLAAQLEAVTEELKQTGLRL